MIMDCNSRKLHRIEMIAALDAQLQGGEEPLKPRLQTIPNAWRDYRMCLTRLGRIVEQIYQTLPTKTLKHMAALCAHGEVLIRFKPVVSNDAQLIMTGDLKELINTAMEAKCTICFEDRAGVKACRLRKALMDIAPPTDLALGDCPYRYVIEHANRGDYI